MDTAPERADDGVAREEDQYAREKQADTALSTLPSKQGDYDCHDSETLFLTAFLEQNPGLTKEQIEEIEALVMDLSKPCRDCHEVRKATIGRVAADQRTMRRAEFNHRAHIVQLRCLDCHTEIPFAEYLESTEAVDARFDSAEIVNLPAIESCRQCHNPKQSTNRCTSCHLFHSDQSRHSELLLYLDEP